MTSRNPQSPINCKQSVSDTSVLLTSASMLAVRLLARFTTLKGDGTKLSIN